MFFFDCFLATPFVSSEFLPDVIFFEILCFFSFWVCATLVGDRKFYSNVLVFELNKKRYKCMFRLVSNLKILKNFKNKYKFSK